MEQYELAALTVTEGPEERQLAFGRAKLTVVSEYGTRLWYIDAEEISDSALLRRFAETDEIGVRISAVTAGGKTFSGEGFFHPNPAHRSAAIRGNGELEGYSRLAGSQP